MKNYKVVKKEDLNKVTVNGEKLSKHIPLLQRVKQNNFASKNNSEDKSIWAFSILSDCFDYNIANSYYLDFVEDHIDKWDSDWEFTSADIEKWYKNKCNSGGIGQALSHLACERSGEDVPEIKMPPLL